MVFRLHGDELVFGGAVHPVQPQIPQMKMMKVHIPFTFKLQDSCRSSHSGESCDLLALILVHPSLFSQIHFLEPPICILSHIFFEM